MCFYFISSNLPLVALPTGPTPFIVCAWISTTVSLWNLPLNTYHVWEPGIVVCLSHCLFFFGKQMTYAIMTPFLLSSCGGDQDTFKDLSLKNLNEIWVGDPVGATCIYEAIFNYIGSISSDVMILVSKSIPDARVLKWLTRAKPSPSWLTPEISTRYFV